MKFEEKIIGLTRMEFYILANAAGIRKLVCYRNEDIQKEPEINQEEYNRAIFSLYKRGLLLSTGENFTMQEEINKVFLSLRKSRQIAGVESNRENAGQVCMYFCDHFFVAVMPGIREEEYVRISVHKTENLEEFLSEKGLLPDDTLSEELLEAQKDEMLVGAGPEELERAGKEGRLLQVPGVETVFAMYSEDRQDGYIGILRQPLQDKIVVLYGDVTEVISYSAGKLADILRTYWERKS